MVVVVVVVVIYGSESDVHHATSSVGILLTLLLWNLVRRNLKVSVWVIPPRLPSTSVTNCPNVQVASGVVKPLGLVRTGDCVFERARYRHG